MIRVFAVFVALAVVLFMHGPSRALAADSWFSQFEQTLAEGGADTGANARTAVKSNAPMTVRPIAQPDGTVVAQFCCKHCSKGKPCGNSCISRKETCRRGAGCACATVDIY